MSTPLRTPKKHRKVLQWRESTPRARDGLAVRTADKTSVENVWTRVWIAAGVGSLSVLLFCWYWRGVMIDRPDFEAVYFGAMAVRNGSNPYGAVVPGLSDAWGLPLHYPMPALLVGLPFTFLPPLLAGAVFVGLTGAALGYAIARAGDRWRLLLLGSHSYIMTVGQGQWSLLFLAAALYPPFNFFAAVKPNVGALVAANVRIVRELVVPVLAGMFLLALSFAILPNWLGAWLSGLGHAPYQATPIMQPAGMLGTALAVTRWKRPEARYALAYALIPQTPAPYTDLLLFAIPRGKWETVCLALLSDVAAFIYSTMPRLPTVVERVTHYSGVSATIMFLPCALMILRRPNVAR